MEPIVSFFFWAFVFVIATGISMGLRDDGWSHSSDNGAARIGYWSIPITLIVTVLVVPVVYAWWIA